MRESHKDRLKRVLILNRGEIALRACRAVRNLGYIPVIFLCKHENRRKWAQVASDFYISEGTTPSETFLNFNEIRNAIRNANSGWIYPGYGFQSENSILADVVQEEEATLVGPSSFILKTMANKLSSMKFAQSWGLNTLGIPLDQITASQFPLLLKAVQGGGGRGNLLVHKLADLDSSIETLKTRSQTLFHDDQLLIERYLPKAFHIELQVMGTGTNCYVIGTRDCTIQRKFQKVIEEGEVRDEIQTHLNPLIPKVEAGLSKMGYKGAGTLEFLWDPKRQELYFMEMNTRIQVEHPVTEELLGIDLVDLQFKIAFGLPVPELATLSKTSRGHALELRIYAEDSSSGFMPDAGKLLFLNLPSLPFCRWDTTYSSHDIISPDFDPMIAKLVIRAPTRDEAIHRALNCLRQTVIHGVNTNLDFLMEILKSEAFRSQSHSVSWVESEFLESFKKKRDEVFERLSNSVLKNTTQIQNQFKKEKSGNTKNNYGKRMSSPCRWREAHR